MRIPVLPVSGSLNEWSIIELQGKIKSKTDNIEGQNIGPLQIEGDHATLNIGNHQLKGKIHKLKKPLLVMRKGTKEGVSVESVIRTKVVFSERPTLLFPNVN